MASAVSLNCSSDFLSASPTSSAAPSESPPPLSVVMTAYNGERFVEDTIRSVLQQTYSNFEFIIVDDGSTDGTEHILARYQKADPRVKVTRQKNQGIAAALNHALALAQHDLVAHIDHDDRALPGWLDSQLDFLLKHPDCSVVSSHGFFISPSGKRFGRSGNTVDVEKGRRELNPSCFVELIHSSVLMRRKDILSVGGYRAVMPEDRDLWGRVVTAGMMIRCNPEPLVEYRLHGRSEIVRKLTPLQTYTRRAIDLNIVRRMQGLPELTPLEVSKLDTSRPVRERWQENRRIQAGTHFRLAARHYSEGQWIPFTRRLAAAVTLRPLYTLSRASQKLNWR